MTVTVRYRRTERYLTPPFGGPIRPYLPVRIQVGGRFIDTLGLVDSGADASLFNADIALALGFTLTLGQEHPIGGIGGNAVAWDFDVVLSVAGERVPAKIGFSPTSPREFGLLGRTDFFAAFHVGFDQRGLQTHLHALPPL